MPSLIDTRPEGPVAISDRSSKLERATRACAVRNYTADTWLRILREAIAEEGNASEADVRIVGIDILLDMLLVYADNDSSQRILCGYLQACCSASPAQDVSKTPLSSAIGAQQHVLRRILDFAAKSDSTTRSIQSESSLANSKPTDSRAALLDDIASILLATRQGEPTKASYTLPPATTVGQSSTIKSIFATLHLLNLSQIFGKTSLYSLSLQLLHSAIQIQSTSSPNWSAEEVQKFQSAISDCRAHSDGEGTMKPSTDATSTESQSLLQSPDTPLTLLRRLERAVEPSARRRVLHPKIGDKRKAEYISSDHKDDVPSKLINCQLELQIILHTLVQDSTVPQHLFSQLRASLFSRDVYMRAAFDSMLTETECATEAVSVWLDDLFSVLADTKALQSPQYDESQNSEVVRSRDEARWHSFAWSVMPTILARIVRDDSSTVSSAIRQVDWQTAVRASLARLCETQKSSCNEDNINQWGKDFQQIMVAKGKVASLGFDSTRSTPSHIIAQLGTAVEHYPDQQSVSASVSEAIQHWCSAGDLSSVHGLLNGLIHESPRMLDMLFLHVSPADILRPICALLDNWVEPEAYGPGQAMEIFGGLLLSIQCVCLRHYLSHLLPTFSTGFIGRVLGVKDFCATALPLRTLSTVQKTLIESWIGALYGNEGIEDDLIRQTNPQDMVVLAVTIVQQSLSAMQHGVIDMDTLQGGLSYFTQDLLNYALPGIVAYLANQHLTPISGVSVPPMSTTLAVLKTLLAADGTPHTVKELVSPTLSRLLALPQTGDPVCASDASELRQSLDSRFAKLAFRQPLRTDSLYTVLATGLHSAKTSRASSSTVNIVDVIDAACEATTSRAVVSTLVRTILFERAVSEQDSHLEHEHATLQYFSTLLTIPLSPVKSRSLHHTYLYDYLPRLLKSIQLSSLDNDDVLAKFERLADATAMVIVRVKALGEKYVTKRGSTAVENKFWGRVDIFAMST